MSALQTGCVDFCGCGVTAVWVDRETRESGKRKGGGVVLLVNNRWCHLRLFTMQEKMCCHDTELLVADLTAE